MSQQTNQETTPTGREVQFIHYRAVKDVVDHGKESMQIDSRSGATIAFAMPDKDKKVPIFYAVAWCHPNDNFSKHLGRVKSRGRLRSEKFVEETQFLDKIEFLEAMDAEMEQYGLVRHGWRIRDTKKAA